MAFVHGKGAFLEIDDSSGTPVDISPFTDSIDGLPGEVELADVTAFGDEGHKRIPGLENSQFTASGSFDPSLIGTLAALRGLSTTSTFTFGPAGSASGNVSLSGECRLSTFNVNPAVAAKVSWSATFMVDGVVTTGTFS